MDKWLDRLDTIDKCHAEIDKLNKLKDIYQYACIGSANVYDRKINKVLKKIEQLSKK